jgi:hypothetical protein
MSVLDMFASALGAFILISVILFPYFNRSMQIKTNEKKQAEIKNSIVEQEATSKKIAETIESHESELREGPEAFAALGQCRRIASHCEAALSKTFLVFGIEWEEDCDVDLYVTDPRGNQFGYTTNNVGSRHFPASQGELSLDMRWGPGIEIWQNPDAQRGDYVISYNLAAAKSVTEVKVKGWWIDRTKGRQDMPERTLHSGSPMTKIATMHLNADGSTELAVAGQR